MANFVQSISYSRAAPALRREMDLLQHRAQPSLCLMPNEALTPLHDATLQALSFYCHADGKMVSYAGVVSKTIQHGGQTFDIAGLSCVATDRSHQGRGFGLRTVAAATEWLEQSNKDFGIFTCDPGLAHFYARAGAWPVVADVVLIGSRDPGALCSVSLRKVVLMRLFSTKAREAATRLANTTIDLGLPVGQFL
jgi:predicted N-acetyltransferase YhbS